MNENFYKKIMRLFQTHPAFTFTGLIILFLQILIPQFLLTEFSPDICHFSGQTAPNIRGRAIRTPPASPAGPPSLSVPYAQAEQHRARSKDDCSGGQCRSSCVLYHE